MPRSRSSEYAGAAGVLGRAARAQRIALVLIAVPVTSWLALAVVDAPSGVPAGWPAAGLIAGLYLTAPRRVRPAVLPASSGLLVIAHLGHDYELVTALGFSLSCVAGAWVVRWRLLRHLDKPRVGLLVAGDVSRLIAATTLGAAAAAAGVGGSVWLAGEGSPVLGAAAAFGTHAASVMMLMPLFVEKPTFAPMADGRERAVQSLLTVGTTVAIFLSASAPPLVFIVMPMFAWLAFRGTLREASLLLAAVGVVSTTMTMLHIGPVWGLQARYGLSPEMAGGFLQLFLIDCALVLLPLSVLTTQQRTSAARAAAQHQTLDRLLSAATGTALVSTDALGRVIVFNPGAEALFGYPAEEMIGATMDRAFEPEELERHASRLGVLPVFADICVAAEHSEEENELWNLPGRDGREQTMRMTLTAVFDDRGAPTGHLCIAEDVTEREAAHQALVTALDHERSAVERLRDVERVKADFVATVSHELRTPITSMIGYLELLEDGSVGELNAEQRTLVGRVDRNGRRLRLLVEDLLMLSRIEARTLTLNAVTTDLREAVEGAYDALQPMLAERDLAVEVGLPDEPVIHQGDPDQLERMVLNLMTNAVKFTPDGGLVQVWIEVDQDVTRLVVSDSGMGIPENEQGQLFTRFFRSSQAVARAIQGTGLGLAIVNAIVSGHDGEISLTSSENEGTTVTASLPRVPAAAVPVPTWAQAQAPH